MSSVIAAARVNFGMYPVFPAAVFRFCEKISFENRFSATSESYFRPPQRVIFFYLNCFLFACFLYFLAVFTCFKFSDTLAIHISSAFFTCERQVLEIRIFRGPHFRTFVSSLFLQFLITFFYILKKCTKFQNPITHARFWRGYSPLQLSFLLFCSIIAKCILFPFFAVTERFPSPT